MPPHLCAPVPAVLHYLQGLTPAGFAGRRNVTKIRALKLPRRYPLFPSRYGPPVGPSVPEHALVARTL